MRFPPFLTATVLAVTITGPADAQREREPETRIYRTPGPGMFGLFEGPRAVLGVTTGSSGGARDTLGVLITSITPNGPAERAGLEEGNRIQAINNVNLRLSAADADDREMSRLMTRRLTRELNRVKPGDEVELRVYGGGRTRAVRVRTADADSIYRRQRRGDSDNRATLGLSLGSTGSVRDTLGVLVVGVNDSGPAARVGIIEGNRIAEINGVNLRTSREDIGDEWVANTRVQRLLREIRRLEPGNEVTLRVWQDGQFRTVRARAVRAADLPRRRGGFFMSGDHIGITMPPIPPIPPMEFERLGPELRYHLERALDGAGRAIEGAGRGIGRKLMDLELDDDFDFDHDFDVDFDDGVRVYKMRPAPSAPRAPRAVPAPAAAPSTRVTTLTRF
jgi:hypothetical protein